MKTGPRYSVIIAAFNEAGSIETCVRAVAAVCPEDCEILVIDGGRDDTAGILETVACDLPQLRCVQNRHDRGKGHAIRLGIALAGAPVHIQFDADLQFLPDDILLLARAVESGSCDVALGSRFTSERAKDETAPVVRNVGNRALSLCASMLFGHRMSDVLSGLKAWSREAANVLDLQSDGFAYEVEIPARALQRGLRVREFPVETRARTTGESKVSILGNGFSILRAMIRFRFNP